MDKVDYSFAGSSNDKIGGCPKKVEPLTLVRSYPARWEQSRIDPDEFRRLRRKGMGYSQLGRHFGRAKSTMVAMAKKLAKQRAKTSS